jgi:hypothetical protein
MNLCHLVWHQRWELAFLGFGDWWKSASGVCLHLLRLYNRNTMKRVFRHNESFVKTDNWKFWRQKKIILIFCRLYRLC